MAEQPQSPPGADSPEKLIGILQSFMGSAALKAGIDLEIFTHISHGADTADKIAAAKGLTPRAARILCDALLAFGVLGKADGRYTLPPAVQMLLVKGSPMYAGGMASLVGNRMIWNEAARLTDIVKAGHTLVEQSAETPDNPFWQDFARGSRQMAQMTGPAVADAAAALFGAAGPAKILDIACGSGFYGFSALKRFPNARLVSVDWPGVLKLAEANARQAGVADRIEFRPADIFKDDLGAGYDLVLAVNIYHHFNVADCVALSRRLFDATARGGAIMLVDFVPDEAREHDRMALAFALTMLIWTREGDTYTLSQYQQMLETAGYKNVVLHLNEVRGPQQFKAIVGRRPQA